MDQKFPTGTSGKLRACRPDKQFDLRMLKSLWLQLIPGKPIMVLLFVFVLIANPARSDEGMWLLPRIGAYNMEDIQSLGGKMSAEEIFSNDDASLSDAVVNVGNVGSGSVVSANGLVLTNHHVIYDHIQRVSTAENDYLTDGYWASSFDGEIPAAGLTVTFLKKIIDVTDEVQKEIASRRERGERVSMLTIGRDIASAYTADTDSQGFLSNHYQGGKYYLYIYEVFKDVRLVGFPPSSIGKFGGDEDNFRWPRHTGDFGFIRVYADNEGQPADYSPDNVPYVPDRYLEINAGGINELDFSMVLGYPGSSQRYLTASQVEDLMKVTHPGRIAARKRRLDIIREEMQASDEVRLKYASKYFNASNGMQLSQGQLEQLRRHDVPEIKRAEEKQFMDWVDEDPVRKKKYGEVLTMIRESVEEKRPTAYAHHLLNEALLMGTEIYVAGIRANVFYRNLDEDISQAELAEVVSGFSGRQSGFYEDYHPPADRRVVAAMMELVSDELPREHQPDIIHYADSAFAGNYMEFAAYMFENSFLTCPERFARFISNPRLEAMEGDPVIRYSVSIYDKAIELRDINRELSEGERAGSRLYMEAIREKSEGDRMYPDANFTMRMSYGKVLGYSPRDAVNYHHITSLSGVMEKEDPEHDDFVVPDDLLSLYHEQQFGPYGDDGRMPVNFITDNDITGGNSGSPVIGANGQLKGLAFDGNWESLAGDVVFFPELNRAIHVDIRYVLFVTDKFAGASNIMNELVIIN